MKSSDAEDLVRQAVQSAEKSYREAHGLDAKHLCDHERLTTWQEEVSTGSGTHTERLEAVLMLKCEDCGDEWHESWRDWL